MERPYKVLVVMMWLINLKGAVIIAKLLTYIPHFPHVVQKDTWIIITILNQQIKQINSIEYKKLVAWIFWANQGFLLGA